MRSPSETLYISIGTSVDACTSDVNKTLFRKQIATKNN